MGRHINFSVRGLSSVLGKAMRVAQSISCDLIILTYQDSRIYIVPMWDDVWSVYCKDMNNGLWLGYCYKNESTWSFCPSKDAMWWTSRFTHGAWNFYVSSDEDINDTIDNIYRDAKTVLYLYPNAGGRYRIAAVERYSNS